MNTYEDFTERLIRKAYVPDPPEPEPKNRLTWVVRDCVDVDHPGVKWTVRLPATAGNQEAEVDVWDLWLPEGSTGTVDIVFPTRNGKGKTGVFKPIIMLSQKYPVPHDSGEYARVTGGKYGTVSYLLRDGKKVTKAEFGW